MKEIESHMENNSKYNIAIVPLPFWHDKTLLQKLIHEIDCMTNSNYLVISRLSYMIPNNLKLISKKSNIAKIEVIKIISRAN